ncbi:MAG: hypothetical protein JXB30_16865 [Anaerolineae bacterium]|nr:hypothetical protein [Anaerolineae bacterium]
MEASQRAMSAKQRDKNLYMPAAIVDVNLPCLFANPATPAIHTPQSPAAAPGWLGYRPVKLLISLLSPMYFQGSDDQIKHWKQNSFGEGIKSLGERFGIP